MSRSGSRPRRWFGAGLLRSVVAAVTAIAMVTISGSTAFAADGGAAAVAKRAAETRQPFTHQRTVNGFTWIQTFVAEGTDSVRSDITFRAPDGDTIFTGYALGVRNVDGSVTVTTTSPMLDKPDVRVIPASEVKAADPVCGPCAAAAGLAAAGAIVACAFTALLGCAAATGIAVGGAAAYCSTNPCEPTNACTPDLLIWSQNGPGTMNWQYAVDCDMSMDYINLHGQLLRNGSEVYYDDWGSCWSQPSCWQGWYAWGLPSGCYRVRLYWDARWRNPATNQYSYYGNTNVSGNQVCI